MFEIEHRYTAAVLCQSQDAADVKSAAVEAALGAANLRGADLRGPRTCGARTCAARKGYYREIWATSMRMRF